MIDWCQSIGIEYKPTYIKRLHHPRKQKNILYPLRLTRDWFRQKEAESQLLNITKTVNPSLSTDQKVESLTEEMYQQLQEFQEDLAKGVFNV